MSGYTENRKSTLLGDHIFLNNNVRVGGAISFGKGYTLGVELDGGYYHEFGNPNKALDDVSLKGFEGNVNFDSYDYNRDFGKIGAEVSISKNDIHGYAKYNILWDKTQMIKKQLWGFHINSNKKLIR